METWSRAIMVGNTGREAALGRGSLLKVSEDIVPAKGLAQYSAYNVKMMALDIEGVGDVVYKSVDHTLGAEEVGIMVIDVPATNSSELVAERYRPKPASWS